MAAGVVNAQPPQRGRAREAAFHGSFIENFTEEAVKEVLMNLAAANEMKNGQIMWPVRIAISGLASTPGGATEIAYLIGKEECLRRMDIGIEKLKNA